MLIGIDACGGWLKLEELGDYAFILSQLYKRDYRKHYINRKDRRLAIVDNGAYELNESINFSSFLKIVKSVARHYDKVIYVLPDKIKHWEKTVEMSARFLTYYVADNAEPLFMCQTLNVVDCIEFAEKYHVRWLGLPIWMDRQIPGVRVRFAQMIKREHPNWYIHLFGLDRLLEVAEAVEYAYSVDTSLPLTLAKNNISSPFLDFPYRLKRITCRDRVSKQRYERAYRNIELLRSLALGGVDERRVRKVNVIK